jgi:hypothetical protein
MRGESGYVGRVEDVMYEQRRKEREQEIHAAIKRAEMMMVSKEFRMKPWEKGRAEMEYLRSKGYRPHPGNRQKILDKMAELGFTAPERTRLWQRLRTLPGVIRRHLAEGTL